MLYLTLLLAFTMLALWHEMGHYLVARLLGCQVHRVQIGFGHSLWEWKPARGTAWALGWLPLGGYTRIHGTHSGDKPTQPHGPRRHYRLHLYRWERFAVVAAGPAMNLLAAALLLAAAATLQGTTVLQELRTMAATLLHIFAQLFSDATPPPLLDGTLAGWCRTAALLSLALCFSNLLPAGKSDGARLLAILRNLPEPR